MHMPGTECSTAHSDSKGDVGVGTGGREAGLRLQESGGFIKNDQDFGSSSWHPLQNMVDGARLVAAVDNWDRASRVSKM